MSRRVIRFYEDIQPANDRVFYMFSDIVFLWTNLRLQRRKNYINWLFPSELDTDTKLTKGLSYKFWTNRNLRRKVVQATLRMMDFLGYKVNPDLSLTQIHPILRTEEGITIGLCSPENFSKITRILHFLDRCDFPIMSSVFFRMLCQAMKESPEFKHLVETKNVIQEWIDTQPYLIESKETKWKIEENVFGKDLADWEKMVIEDTLATRRQVANDAWREM